MATTFTKIAAVTVGSGGAASIAFTSIPSTYTDLVLKWSGRIDNNNDFFIKFNSSTTNYSGKILYANSGSANSFNGGTDGKYLSGWPDQSANTANVFSNNEIYIPNYGSSNNKSFSVDTVKEDNSTDWFVGLLAGLWSDTTAINAVTLTLVSGSFVQYSTAVLYGIKNS